jgi:hypothetical protein
MSFLLASVFLIAIDRPRAICVQLQGNEPSPQFIIRLAITEQGGEEAAKKLQSFRWKEKGKIFHKQLELSYDLTCWFSTPLQSRLELRTADSRTLIRVFESNKGWEKEGDMPPRVINKSEIIRNVKNCHSHEVNQLFTLLDGKAKIKMSRKFPSKKKTLG